MEIITLIIFLVVVFIIFFLLREFNTWYFKFNLMVSNQYKTNSLLEEILQELKNSGLEESTVVTEKINDPIFSGKTVAVFGPFRNVPVDKVKQQLVNRKARIENDITSETDLIVYGDLITAQTEKKIKNSGIQAISEEEFQKKIL